MLLEVFIDCGEVDDSVDSRLMIITIDLLVGLNYILKHGDCLIVSSSNLVEQCLVIDDTNMRRVFLWKVVINVNSMLIENSLSNLVLPQVHCLPKSTERVLHSLELLWVNLWIRSVWVKLCVFLFLDHFGFQWLKVGSKGTTHIEMSLECSSRQQGKHGMSGACSKEVSG